MLRVALGGRGCSIPVGIGSDARNGLCFGGCSELYSEVRGVQSLSGLGVIREMGIMVGRCSELHSEGRVGSIPVGIGSGGLENRGRFAGFDKPGGLEWV